MKKAIFPILISLCSLVASAQVRRHTANLAFGGQLVQPRGDFANQYSGYPSGFSGSLSIPYRRSMLETGGSFAWNSMGSKNEPVSVLVGQDQAGTNIYSRGTMRVRLNNYRYGLFLRLRPFTGMVQPYADAIVGMDHFQTATDIQIDNSGYSQGSKQRVEQRSIAFNAGYALGLRVRLARLLYLDARFESLVGTKASYVDKESIQITQGDQINFKTLSSKTDKNIFQLGIALQF